MDDLRILSFGPTNMEHDDFPLSPQSSSIAPDHEDFILSLNATSTPPMESTSSIIDETSRFLAGESAGLDYSVISVVILTLGIVLVVEVLRHQLDVKASGNPFFKTVLELMYRERESLPEWNLRILCDVL